MNYQTYLFFDGKSEVIHGYDTPQHTYPLGSLCIGTMDVKWDTWLESARVLYKQVQALPVSERRTIAQGLDDPEHCAYYLVARFYHALTSAVQAVSPAMSELLRGYALALFRHYNERLKYYEKYMTQQIDRQNDDSGLSREELIATHTRYGGLAMTADLMEDYCRGYPEVSERMALFRKLGTADYSLCSTALKELEYFIRALDQMNQFRTDLQELLPLTLCGEDDRPLPTPAQALLALEQAGNPLCRRYRQMQDKVHIEMQQYESPEKKKGGIAAALFYASDTLPALIYLEFMQMCSQNLPIARCANCGGLFIPFSARAIYCDRVIEPQTGATCKSAAAKRNYAQNSKADPARSLYDKLRNKYQMRCSRAPDNAKMRQKYEAWKKKAQVALTKYHLGEIGWEEFKNDLMR